MCACVCVDDFISNFFATLLYPKPGSFLKDRGFIFLWSNLHQSRILRENIPSLIQMISRCTSFLVRTTNRVQRNILYHEQHLESYAELSEPVRMPSSLTFAVIPRFDAATKLLHQLGEGDHDSLPISE